MTAGKEKAGGFGFVRSRFVGARAYPQQTAGDPGNEAGPFVPQNCNYLVRFPKSTLHGGGERKTPWGQRRHVTLVGQSLCTWSGAVRNFYLSSSQDKVHGRGQV